MPAVRSASSAGVPREARRTEGRTRSPARSAPETRSAISAWTRSAVSPSRRASRAWIAGTSCTASSRPAPALSIAWAIARFCRRKGSPSSTVSRHASRRNVQSAASSESATRAIRSESPAIRGSSATASGARRRARAPRTASDSGPAAETPWGFRMRASSRPPSVRSASPGATRTRTAANFQGRSASRRLPRRGPRSASARPHPMPEPIDPHAARGGRTPSHIIPENSDSSRRTRMCPISKPSPVMRTRPGYRNSIARLPTVSIGMGYAKPS